VVNTLGLEFITNDVKAKRELGFTQKAAFVKTIMNTQSWREFLKKSFVNLATLSLTSPI
jgi:hypothetical protein